MFLHPFLLALVSAALADYVSLNSAEGDRYFQNTIVEEDKALAKNLPPKVMKPPLTLPPLSNRTALFKYFGVQDYWKQLKIPEALNTLALNDRKENLFEQGLQFDRKKYLEVELPKQIPHPVPRAFHSSLWRGLLFSKLILLIIYLVARCRRKQEQNREEGTKEEEICKMP